MWAAGSEEVAVDAPREDFANEPVARPVKRLKLQEEDIRNNAGAGPSLPASSAALATLQEQELHGKKGPDAGLGLGELLALPESVLHHIYCKLDSESLNNLSCCCKHFWTRDLATGLRFTHKYAKEAVERVVGETRSKRWKQFNWIQRLRIEEVVTMFDREHGEATQFSFKEDIDSKVVTEIRLESPGPRILVSDASTAQSSLLRWKMLLKGNNAAEFGVIPACLQESNKALHKSMQSEEGDRAVGFHSAITVGSLLPARMPLMKGSEVEVLATASYVEFIVTNPADGNEMLWQQNNTVSRPYKGPPEMRLHIPYAFKGPIKLAVTAWHRAAFDVLHAQEQLRLRQL